MAENELDWSVRVIEHPFKRNKFTLYCKTPTQSLTLTRSTSAIKSLDNSVSKV